MQGNAIEKIGEYGSRYMILYIEIGIISVIILSLILIHRRRQFSEMLDGHFHRMALWMSICFVVSDVLWFAMDQNFIKQSWAALMTFKSLYFMFTTLMCYAWFLYFEYMQGSGMVTEKKRLCLVSIPVFLQLILLSVNFKTGILFGTDAEMDYYRGPLFALIYLLSYSYVISTCGGALYRACREENFAEREKYITIALFPILPYLCGVLQFFERRLPCAGPGVSLAAALLYMNSLSQAVSRDAMTGLNNRRQFLKDADRVLKEHGTDNRVRILMIDFDYFKQINDKYGHIEGDNALIRTADVLRKAVYMAGRRNVIARYGGDEFVVLMPNASAADELKLRRQIAETLAKENKQSNKEYSISLSIGSADNRETNSLKTLIMLADEDMYIEKQLHHA